MCLFENYYETHNVKRRYMIFKNSKNKIKEPHIYIKNGIAKRDHCNVMTKVVCISGLEKLLSMIHCGHFNDVKYY